MHLPPLTELVHWFGTFVLVMILLRLVLPPKELVLQYWPKARFYPFVVDVVSRWAALDVRAKLWNIPKHVDNYERKKRETGELLRPPGREGNK